MTEMLCPTCQTQQTKFAERNGHTICLACNQREAHKEYMIAWRLAATPESVAKAKQERKVREAKLTDEERVAKHKAQYESRKARYTEEDWARVAARRKELREQKKNKPVE